MIMAITSVPCHPSGTQVLATSDVCQRLVKPQEARLIWCRWQPKWHIPEGGGGGGGGGGGEALLEASQTHTAEALSERDETIQVAPAGRGGGGGGGGAGFVENIADSHRQRGQLDDFISLSENQVAAFSSRSSGCGSSRLSVAVPSWCTEICLDLRQWAGPE